MSSVGIIFITIFWVVMSIPCISIALIGKKFIDQLGRYPSKTKALQMGVLIKLTVVEVISFTLLLLIYRVLV